MRGKFNPSLSESPEPNGQPSKKEMLAQVAARREELGRLLPQLATALNDLCLACARMTVPEKVALVRSALEVYGADGSLDEFVSWFELERDNELES